MIKERVRAEKASLPYTYYPIVMVVDMINFVVTWLNVFLLANGIWNMSPQLIVVGTNLSYNKHCQCLFGAYVQTHEEGTNDMD